MGQTRVFSLFYTVEARFHRVCPWDKPGLSLGQSRGRRAAQKVYVKKVYVPFLLALNPGAGILGDIHNHQHPHASTKKRVAIPSASHRGAEVGHPWKCSRKCSRGWVLWEIGVLGGVLPRVLREIGGAPGSAPESAQCGASTERALSGALPGAPPISLSTLGSTSRSTPISQSTLGSTSESTFKDVPLQHPCDWRMGLQEKGGFSKGSFCRVECHAQDNK